MAAAYDRFNMSFRKVFLISLPLLVIGYSVFVFGPRLIQAHYRSATPDSDMQAQRAEYTRLANSELKLTGEAKISSEKKRYKLSLWLLARGFDIDGTDAEPSIWQPWTDLINYWEDDDGSRFYRQAP